MLSCTRPFSLVPKIDVFGHPKDLSGKIDVFGHPKDLSGTSPEGHPRTDIGQQHWDIRTNKDFSNYMKMTFLHQFNKVGVTGIEYGNEKRVVWPGCCSWFE